jgi:hypothetical protein
MVPVDVASESVEGKVGNTSLYNVTIKSVRSEQVMCTDTTCNPEVYLEYPHSPPSTPESAVSKKIENDLIIVLIPIAALVIAALIGIFSRIFRRKPE